MKTITKTKNALFALILIAVVVFACNKNTKLIPSPKDSTSSVKKSVNKLPGDCPYDCYDTRCKAYQGDQYCGVSVVTNSSNPYDYTGSLHNQGLDAIFAPVTSISGISEASLNSSVATFMSGQGYNSSQVAAIQAKADSLGYTVFADTSYATNQSSLITKMYNDGNISSTFQTYANSLLSLADNDLSGDVSSDAYDSFASDVISLESSISANGSLSALEKQNLLAACSIARYSAEYWSNYMITQNGGPIIDGVKSKKLLSVKINKVSLALQKVAKSDIVGGIGGAVTGAITGAIAGGIGAIPGAAVGWVAGGIGTSVGVAFAQIFGWTL